MLADFIGILFVIATAVVLFSLKKKPNYQNVRLNGAHFKDEKLAWLIEKRKVNNPYEEPVGGDTGRCQFCGSTNVDRGYREVTTIISTAKKTRECYYCGEIVDLQ